MSKRLGAALDGLRAAVFEAYAALAEEGAKTGAEQQRRESSLQSIGENPGVAPAGRVFSHASRIARIYSLIGARPRWQRMLQSELRCQMRSSSGTPTHQARSQGMTMDPAIIRS